MDKAWTIAIKIKMRKNFLHMAIWAFCAAVAIYGVANAYQLKDDFKLFMRIIFALVILSYCINIYIKYPGKKS